MAEQDYSKLVWTDDDGNTYIGPFLIAWDMPITPADIEALQQEALSGRLFGWWLDGAKDESEDA